MRISPTLTVEENKIQNFAIVADSCEPCRPQKTFASYCSACSAKRASPESLCRYCIMPNSLINMNINLIFIFEYISIFNKLI